MGLVETIINRKSQPLSEGEISSEDLNEIFQCALTAPDHKRLRPWKFIVCNPEHKTLLRGLILASNTPDLAGDRKAAYDQVTQKLGRTPHIIICVVRILKDTSVPEIEQILSGGAAVQNMVIAAEAKGYGCYWRTGEWAYDPALRKSLNLNEDMRIIGFLGLGKTERPRTGNNQRPDVRDHFFKLDEYLSHS